jgi:hypothetical protein
MHPVGVVSANAPKVHRYVWRPKEYDKLPGGTIAICRKPPKDRGRFIHSLKLTSR